MISQLASPNKNKIIYPDSDGQPMADNTLQFSWIVTIKENLECLFADQEDVFVAGDLLWYSVEGQPKICQAPDTLVVFHRPKGYRGSYKQWEEDNIPPQVVFEILSPGYNFNTMLEKFNFYEFYGAKEYYIYEYNYNYLQGWTRQNDELEPISEMNGWISPRLQIRFELSEAELALYYPDGKKFLTFVELSQRADQAQQQADLAQQQAQLESQRADQESQRADQEHQRAERLANLLREQGINPDQI